MMEAFFCQFFIELSFISSKFRAFKFLIKFFWFLFFTIRDAFRDALMKLALFFFGKEKEEYLWGK